MNGSISGSHRLSNDRLQAICENEFSNASPSQTVKNSVQAQIEKMFTDIAKDETAISNCFSIKYLGALPLVGKVTSLLGLQDPLRQLYLSGAGHGVSETDFAIDNLAEEKKNVPLIKCHIVSFVNYVQMYDVLEIHIKKEKSRKIRPRRGAKERKKTHLQR